MKNIFKTTLLSFIFVLAFAISVPVLAQPGTPGNGHGQSGNQAPGGKAPIASGLAILIGLGGAYASKKLWDSRKENG
jgi:hypothetical protein